MRLEQLEYFVEISVSKSITTAAENLFISQSALSRSIKALEEELNVELLSRSVEGVKLTETGEILLPFMIEVLEKVELLKNASRQLAGEEISENLEGSLKVSTIPVIADMLIFPTLDQMGDLLPNVHVQVDIREFGGFNEIWFSDKVDMVVSVNINNILDELLKTTMLHVEPLFCDNFSVVVGKTHPLAKKRIVTLEEALNYKLIAHYNGQDLDEFYQNFSDRREPLDILLKSNNQRIITQALEKGEGVLITNNLLIQNDFYKNKELVVIPQKNSKGVYYALYREDSEKKTLIQTFIKILKSFRMSSEKLRSLHT